MFDNSKSFLTCSLSLQLSHMPEQGMDSQVSRKWPAILSLLCKVYTCQ